MGADFHGSFVYVRRRQWHPTPALLPGKSHGQRSLVGCSPWGHKESDMTEQLPFHFSLSFIGEGNGNPLQCSCLENPRDGGAWWAAVYGVAQSQTWLKRLSSSSSIVYVRLPHIHFEAKVSLPINWHLRRIAFKQFRPQSILCVIAFQIIGTHIWNTCVHRP